MDELIKVGDIAGRYGVSTRTLRYYEEMGLIQSQRVQDYAYRMYDEASVTRLEQILILRKLNISIKDIRRIFDAPGSEVVLEVLGKKVDSIDEEVSLLQELKDIVLGFIRQIEQADFSKSKDVKLLYDKAKEIEGRLTNVDYDGNAANINRLLDVTEKLKKAPEVHVVRIPKFRALSSGYDTFENLFSEDGFDKWMGTHCHLEKKIIFDCADFMWHENGKTIWIWAIADDVTASDTAPYEIIEFEGGLYAAAVSIDGDDDINGRVYNGIMQWIKTSGFEPDDRPGHQTLFNMIYPLKEIKVALGYHQLELYVPIKIKEAEQNGKG